MGHFTVYAEGYQAVVNLILYSAPHDTLAESILSRCPI